MPSCGHVASTQPQKMFRSHFMSLLGQQRLRNAQKWKTLEQNHFLLSNTKICDILNAVIFVVTQLKFLLTVNHRSQYRCIESLISKLEACKTVRFNLVQKWTKTSETADTEFELQVHGEFTVWIFCCHCNSRSNRRILLSQNRTCYK